MHQPVGELPQLRFEIIEAARILRKRARLSKPAKRAKRAKRNGSTVQDIYTYSDRNKNPEFAAVVYRALLRAAESARRTARMYGTPLYYWENGRVVAKRP